LKLGVRQLCLTVYCLFAHPKHKHHKITTTRLIYIVTQTLQNGVLEQNAE